MENRDSIVRKLAALKATFEHKSTSEAEATAAMTMYQKLMHKYNLTETDIHIKDSGIKMGKFYPEHDNGKHKPLMFYIVVPIAMVTDTHVEWDYSDNSATFIGTMADVQYAEFLFMMIERSFIPSWKAFRYSFDYTKLHRSGVHGRTISSSFKAGFRDRMTARLLEMAEENKAQGTGLIVLKNALIKAAMDQAGKKMHGYSKSVAMYKDQSAFGAGQKAGESVRLRNETESQFAGYLEGK